MPTTDRKLRVFLCHASQDKPVVRDLYQKLSAEGWMEPWLDAKKLLPGHDWRTEIEEAVETADNVVLCLSSTSVSKEGFIQKELRYAREIALEKPEGSIFLIPLRLDDCEVPRGLRFIQWVDYFGEKKEQSYGDLLESLKIRLEEKTRKEAEEKVRKDTEEKIRLEAEERAHQELKARIEQEAREKVRHEMEKRLRLEAEARARAEYVAQEQEHKLTKEKHPPVVSVVEPPVPAREEKSIPERHDATQSLPTPVKRIPGGHDIYLFGEMEFVKIPAGKFLMGSADSDKLAYRNEKPQHSVDIPYDYWLARFPVTNEQYARYVKAANKEHPLNDWQEKKDHPVTWVSWDDATAYCQWLNDLLKGNLPQNYFLRLPTEAEWEKVARGVDGRIYPWGNIFDVNKCNITESGIGCTTPVGKYSPQGDSPYGCTDMSGNVWEWTHSQRYPYPYQVEDGREDEEAGDSHVLRGGSWGYDIRDARCAYRSDDPPVGDNRGFRVVASPALPQEETW